MATYRQVHTSFWQDAFVLELTPEEKYFYIYLMTNSKTSQCGIYELPKRIIETETGYNRETVDKLLHRFTEYGKIKYNDPTKEIMIFNWLKHNAIHSPKVKACIEKELSNVKFQPFVEMFNTLCIQYRYGIDTLSIDYGEEKEKEKEKEDKKNKNKNSPEKMKLAEFVSMTQEQYDKLISQYGETNTKRFIEVLDNYKGAKGKSYKDDYRAILNWVVDRVLDYKTSGSAGRGRSGNAGSTGLEPNRERLYRKIGHIE